MSTKKLSKKDALKLRAMEAGFQGFEADAFANCLRRFEESVRHDERLYTKESIRSLLRQIHDAISLSSPPPTKERNA